MKGKEEKKPCFWEKCCVLIGQISKAIGYLLGQVGWEKKKRWFLPPGNLVSFLPLPKPINVNIKEPEKGDSLEPKESVT